MKTGKSRYMRLVAEDFLTARWWLLAVPAVLFVVAGWLYSPVWYMVLLVFICLVAPPFMAILFINYSLTDEAVAAITPHMASSDSDGNIVLTFIPDGDTGRQRKDFTLKKHSIKSVEQRGDELILRIRQRPFRYVILPLDGFENILTYNSYLNTL